MTAPDPTTPPSAYSDSLRQLLLDIIAVRDGVVTKADARLAKYSGYYRDGIVTKSASNLAHYLALRQNDLRHLQQRLAHAGLSSLGRAEASVLATLDAVIDLLSRATDPHYALAANSPSTSGFTRGLQLLDQHTIELFGPYFEKTKAHVMVTLGTEAAWDYPLLTALLEKGMTCARINCAHDNPAIWQAMINNVRRAETETGRSCRVLMDLAGHKIRTAEVALGPAVQALKIKHDSYGRCSRPASWLFVSDALSNPSIPEGSICLPIPHAFNEQLTAGATLQLKDVRGKRRQCRVESALAAGIWRISCQQSSYVAPGCRVSLLNEQNACVSTVELGDFVGKPQKLLLFAQDQLLLTTADRLGEPALKAASGECLHPAHIGCTLSEAIHRLHIGDPVWIDDGKLGAVVEAITDEGVLLRVEKARSSGVSIAADKGINFPQTDLGLPALSQKDLEDLDFACAHADLIGFSFVESLDDMEQLMAALAERGATDLPIIAKIETNRAVKNLPEIILGSLGRHSLGIMIARGDLAVELGSARLAEIQEELLWLCEAAHVPVIWATQVLESIAKKGTKSRPEFTDAAMAVRAECVMLNKGPYIVDALEALVNVMCRMQEHQRKKFPKLRALHW
jgi:pyruvate kinase